MQPLSCTYSFYRSSSKIVRCVPFLTGCTSTVSLLPTLHRLRFHLHTVSERLSKAGILFSKKIVSINGNQQGEWRSCFQLGVHLDLGLQIPQKKPLSSKIIKKKIQMPRNGTTYFVLYKIGICMPCMMYINTMKSLCRVYL